MIYVVFFKLRLFFVELKFSYLPISKSPIVYQLESKRIQETICGTYIVTCKCHVARNWV